MRLVSLILIISLFSTISLANEILFQSPINLNIEKKNCPFEEFCELYLKDKDVEEFIKKEIKADYVVVSLDECLDVALKNNFDIQINEKTYFSSKYLYQNALSKFLPVLATTSYLAEYSGQILVGGVLRDNFKETALSVNITLKHVLTDGGRQIFEAKAKKYFLKSAKHNLNFSKTKILYLTSKYYYELLCSKIHIQVYLKNFIDRRAQFQLSEKFYNSQRATEFDVIRCQFEMADAKIKLINTLTSFRNSQVKLANVMGIDVKTSLMPFEDSIKPINLFDDSLDIEVLKKIAIENREDLMAYKNLIYQEQEQKKLYMSEFLPHPSIHYQQQFQGTLKASVRPNYILTAYLTWNLGENMLVGTVTKMKAKNEEIKRKKIEYENLAREIESKLIEVKYSSIFNKKGILSAQDKVGYSAKSSKLAVERFNHSKGILLDVIDAQNDLTDARIQLTDSILNYNLSQLGLIYYSVTINLEDIILQYQP